MPSLLVASPCPAFYFLTQLKPIHSGHVEIDQCCAVRDSAQEIEGGWTIHGRIKAKSFLFEIESEYSGEYGVVMYNEDILLAGLAEKSHCEHPLTVWRAWAELQGGSIVIPAMCVPLAPFLFLKRINLTS